MGDERRWKESRLADPASSGLEDGWKDLMSRWAQFKGLWAELGILETQGPLDDDDIRSTIRRGGVEGMGAGT